MYDKIVGCSLLAEAFDGMNKKFRLEFCTVAQWMNGEIVEERLFYDLVGMMRQLGLM